MNPVFEYRAGQQLPARGLPASGPFTVQFSKPLMDSDFAPLSALSAARPEMKLRVYQQGLEAPVTSLSFLSWFKELRRFQCDVWNLTNFEGLSHLRADLTSLELGATSSKACSLAPLAKFKDLQELRIEGHTKDIEVLRGLHGLERLTLRSVTLPGLEFLSSLKKLWWVAIKLGGTTDLSSLRHLPLKYLELWQIRGLEDLSVVASMSALQYLFLQNLNKVSELPSLKDLAELRRVYIEGVTSLTDLRRVSEAPKLQELLLVNMPHLNPDGLAFFRGHHTLRGVGLGLNSDKKNRAARLAVGLPDIAGGEFNFH